MNKMDKMGKTEPSGLRSFMVSNPESGEKFGDLISDSCRESKRPLKIGLVQTGYFEYWAQYPELYGIVAKDAGQVSAEIGKLGDLADAGIIDTADSAIEAGRFLRDKNIDVLVLSYRTYLPDSFMHGLLGLLPGIPLLFMASQDKTETSDPKKTDYMQVLRNSGLMSEVQLVAGFKKMGIYEKGAYIEVAAGNIYDSGYYKKIGLYLKVMALQRKLGFMTIGTIGNVFRGMFDFEYDRTKIKGGIGPEVVNISISLLEDEFLAVCPEGRAVADMKAFVGESYQIEGVGEEDIGKACRLAVAMKNLCARFNLDGITLLGQHFVEKLFGTQPFLAINELQRDNFCLGATEGDVLGVIAMIIMKEFTGNTPWQLEYSEFDVPRNAFMLLGHGHCDPNEAKGKLRMTPACEHWGHEGTGVSFEGVPKPGICTMAHFVEDKNGWRMFVCPGEILDTEPLPIGEVHAYVKVDMPILEFTEKLVKAGLPHHAITVRGDCVREMKMLADMLGMPSMTIE